MKMQGWLLNLDDLGTVSHDRGNHGHNLGDPDANAVRRQINILFDIPQVHLLSNRQLLQLGEDIFHFQRRRLLLPFQSQHLILKCHLDVSNAFAHQLMPRVEAILVPEPGRDFANEIATAGVGKQIPSR